MPNFTYNRANCVTLCRKYWHMYI